MKTPQDEAQEHLRNALRLLDDGIARIYVRVEIEKALRKLEQPKK